MAQKIVGLDVGHYAIKAVVLESTYRGWELVDFHEMKIASDYVTAQSLIGEISIVDDEEILSSQEVEESEEETSDENEEEPEEKDTPPTDPERERIRLAVQHFIRLYGQNWDSVYTALSGDRISVKLMKLPFAETRQIDQTLNFSLEEVTPFSLADKIVDYQILSKESGESRILAGILDSRFMENYLADFTASGKEPKAVIIDVLSIGNLFQQLISDEKKEGTHSVVDIGHRKTSICILKDGNIEFVRTVPFGGQDITKAITEATNLSFEEAENLKHTDGLLASGEIQAETQQQVDLSEIIAQSTAPLLQHLKLTFQAYTASSRNHVEFVHLTGGSSRLTNIAPWVAEQLDMPVDLFNFIKSEFSKVPDAEELEPEMASGLGMAFFGLSGQRLKRLNFRKGDFAFKGDFELWKGRILQLAINMAFIFLFVLVNIASQFHVLSAEEDRMAESIADACKSILGKEVNDAKICTSQMMEVISSGSTGSTKLIPEISVITLYDELVARMAMEGVVIDLNEMEISEKKIKVKGEVDDIPTVGKIVENLKDYKCFETVNQGPTRKNVKGDKIQFSLNITIGCGEKKKKTASRAGEIK